MLYGHLVLLDAKDTIETYEFNIHRMAAKVIATVILRAAPMECVSACLYSASGAEVRTLGRHSLYNQQV